MSLALAVLFAPAHAARALIVALQLTEQWGGHNRTAPATRQEDRYGR